MSQMSQGAQLHLALFLDGQLILGAMESRLAHYPGAIRGILRPVRAHAKDK
jgi:hypothetical protein